MNPPDLLPFAAFGGNWAAYETELHRIFIADLANGVVQYGGLRVGCRRHPEAAGRWASFWHLVQEGRVEDDRLPDLRRCERIRLVRWVIENALTHGQVHPCRDPLAALHSSGTGRAGAFLAVRRLGHPAGKVRHR
jgi:hypothetical protein